MPARVPDGVVYLTGGIDSQTSGRYECYVWGWGAEEECWLIDKTIVLGRYDEEDTLQRVDGVIRKQYRRSDGTTIGVSRWAWDTGGIDAQVVYNRSLKLGPLWVIPIKGASSYGQPVVNMPRTRNANKVYLSLIGTDTAKDLLAMRLPLEPDSKSATPSAIHFPNDDEIFGTTEAKQLVSEVLIPKLINGRVVYRWDNRGRRNEALDCWVYALAALRISKVKFVSSSISRRSLSNGKITKQTVSRGDGQNARRELMMSREVLTERLLEAEIALHKLLTGRSTVSLSHGDSAGNNRSYQYSQASIEQLRTYIIELKSQLGLSTGRRRPVGVRL